MSAEIFTCKQCGEEFCYYYDFNDDNTIVSQTTCNCRKKIITTKSLDEALKLISELIQKEKYDSKKSIPENKRHSERS